VTGGELVVQRHVQKADLAEEAFTNPPYGSPWQQWGSIVAYLLVAFGVWGTIMFSLMQRSAQKELVRRSKAKSDHADERVALAREIAAKSQASAAESKKRAQELALKVARRRLADRTRISGAASV